MATTKSTTGAKHQRFSLRMHAQGLWEAAWGREGDERIVTLKQNTNSSWSAFKDRKDASHPARALARGWTKHEAATYALLSMAEDLLGIMAAPALSVEAESEPKPKAKASTRKAPASTRTTAKASTRKAPASKGAAKPVSKLASTAAPE